MKRRATPGDGVLTDAATSSRYSPPTNIETRHRRTSRRTDLTAPFLLTEFTWRNGAKSGGGRALDEPTLESVWCTIVCVISLPQRTKVCACVPKLELDLHQNSIGQGLLDRKGRELRPCRMGTGPSDNPRSAYSPITSLPRYPGIPRTWRREHAADQQDKCGMEL